MTHPLSNLQQPYVPEAEQSVLGALMLDGNAWDGIAGMLTYTDFYTQDHQIAFRAIEQLAAEKQPIDVVTVTERVVALAERDDKFLAYLGEIANNTPSAANIGHYARIVREQARLRALSRLGVDCSRLACERGAQSSDVLEKIDQRLYALSQHRQHNEFVNVKETLNQVIETIENNFERDNPVIGIPSGLADLDAITSGFQPGQLIVIAGRPSMGKTSLALSLQASLLQSLDYKAFCVQTYSMEMSAQELMLRYLALLARLPVKALMQGHLQDDDEWKRLSDAVGFLSQNEHRLVIDDTPALTPSELRAKARRSARLHGQPKLIVVDYLQLMRCAGTENRNQEISEISRSLKALAKELGCAILALSQLNRSVEQRPNKRPIMSDLRESGAIEQDADLILFIYRDEVYNPDSSDQGTAELILSKQRNGPTGLVRTAFIAAETRFANLDKTGYFGRAD